MRDNMAGHEILIRRDSITSDDFNWILQYPSAATGNLTPISITIEAHSVFHSILSALFGKSVVHVRLNPRITDRYAAVIEIFDTLLAQNASRIGFDLLRKNLEAGIKGEILISDEAAEGISLFISADSSSDVDDQDILLHRDGTWSYKLFAEQQTAKEAAAKEAAAKEAAAKAAAAEAAAAAAEEAADSAVGE